MMRFSSILCVVEPDTQLETVVQQALRISRQHQAQIRFLSVLDDSEIGVGLSTRFDDRSIGVDDLVSEKSNEINRRLKAIEPALKHGVDVLVGVGFIEVIKSVVTDSHDLVVKCADDVDWLDRLFASDDMHLLRKCPCPVLMLKPGQVSAFGNILATIDLNDKSLDPMKSEVQDKLNRHVLRHSVGFAMPDLATLHIGTVWDAFGEGFYRYGPFSQLSEKSVEMYVEKARRVCADNMTSLTRSVNEEIGNDALNYLAPKIHLVKGRPAVEIPLLAQQLAIDLVVMGTVGRVGVPGLFIGNTAESILEQVKCSVLAVKPEGFQTPVV